MTAIPELRLPFKYTVLEVRGAIVALHREHCFDPFVTYRFDEEGHCFGGDYCNTLEACALSLSIRTAGAAQ